MFAALLLGSAQTALGADPTRTTTFLPRGTATPPAIVSIVIDDLGDRRTEGLQAIELPGSVTYAVLPHTAHGSSLARLAHSLGKEVLVHIPMEAVSGRALGPGGLTAMLSKQQFERRLLAAIESVPHAQGVSNHMGSRLTSMPQQMRWLMGVIKMRHDWMFLDSRTTSDSVALSIARDAGLRTTARDVFLDNDVNVDAIRTRYREFIAKARMHGSAVAIGHPYPETLQVLAEELPHLNRQDSNHTDARKRAYLAPSARQIRLVPLSTLIARQAPRFSARPARQPAAGKPPHHQAASSTTAPPQPSWVETHPAHR